jgi:hypothetical protein
LALKPRSALEAGAPTRAALKQGWPGLASCHGTALDSYPRTAPSGEGPAIDPSGERHRRPASCRTGRDLRRRHLMGPPLMPSGPGGSRAARARSRPAR